MGKRRYSASKIARTPSLKKKLAEILAEYHEGRDKISLHQMLAYGHRGYISYDESDLCKMFDKLYSKQLEQAAERRKSIEEQKINPRHQWEVTRKEKELADIEAALKKFNDIADELFESKVLM